LFGLSSVLGLFVDVPPHLLTLEGFCRDRLPAVPRPLGNLNLIVFFFGERCLQFSPDRHPSGSHFPAYFPALRVSSPSFSFWPAHFECIGKWLIWPRAIGYQASLAPVENLIEFISLYA